MKSWAIPPRQGADRFHLLRLEKLRQKFFLFLFRKLTGGDVAEHADGTAIATDIVHDRCDGNARPQDRAVSAKESTFAVLRNALDQQGGLHVVIRPVFGVHETPYGLSFQFIARPPQHAAHLRVDHYRTILFVQFPEAVVGRIDDTPVPLLALPESRLRLSIFRYVFGDAEKGVRFAVAVDGGGKCLHIHHLPVLVPEPVGHTQLLIPDLGDLVHDPDGRVVLEGIEERGVVQ